VALVSKGTRTTGSVHPPSPPRPGNPQIPGYLPLRHVYADSYSVVLFRAGGAVGVTPAGLANYRLLRGSSASVLLEPAGR
jgi:hypothetical protein